MVWKFLFKLSFIIILFYTIVVYSSQEVEQDLAVKVYLRDGSSLVGYIVSESDTTREFVTLSGIEISLRPYQIKKIINLKGVITNGSYIREDPNSTRLVFSATARPLKSGTGYVSLYELFFPFVAYGVGDIFTVAGGMTLFPGAETQLYYLAPKVTLVNSSNFQVAAGLLNAGVFGYSGNVGIVYTVTTIGSKTQAVTCGFGWGYAGKDRANSPVVMLGGELQLSNSFKLLTENWFPPYGSFPIFSFGVRFFGENLASDISAILLPIMDPDMDSNGIVFFPWMTIAYNFGD